MTETIIWNWRNCVPEKKMGFIVIVVRKGTIAEVIQTLIREVVVILEEKQKNRRHGGHKNPLDRDGNLSCCNICESIYNWFTDCLEKRHEAEISLFSNDIQEYYSCSRTVCGDVWLKVFIKSLNPIDATTIIEMKSRVFQTTLRSGGWGGGD